MPEQASQLRADILPALLPQVVTLAERAGARILDIYSTEFEVTHKDDESPLTQADLAAHRALAEGLAVLEPAFPLLSEESGEHAFAARQSWRTLWLVDPLDGTREFVKRNDEFTVNVALVHDHDVVLGVVHAPALAISYAACRGHGAWRRQGVQAPRAIEVARTPRTPLRVAGSRSHAGKSLQRFLARVGEHELISMGSALKLCLVADGSVDVYPRLGPTSEWDTAASQCVVEEAGGLVTDTHMQPLRYNARDTLLNPHFLAFGDRTRDWSAYL